MLTNDALIQGWDQWMRARNLADKTRYEYSYAVVRFLSELTPPRHVSQVTEQDVVIFLTLRGTRGAAKQQYMKGLRSFFGYLADHTEDSSVTPETNPTRHVRPKVPGSPPPDAYSIGECVALLHAAAERGQRRADALQVVYGLGLRRTEMCRLRPQDVEWERDRVAVTGKGGKIRYVPMTAMAREALARLVKIRSAGETILGVTPARLTAWADEAARDAQVKRSFRSLHILRRSYATHLRRAGIDVAVISRLLGHSNLAITDRYIAIEEDEKVAAVRVLTLAGE